MLCCIALGVSWSEYFMYRQILSLPHLRNIHVTYHLFAFHLQPAADRQLRIRSCMGHPHKVFVYTHLQHTTSNDEIKFPMLVS